MSYIDLRVPRDQAGKAIAVLIAEDVAALITLDSHPPAAGPEVEISVGEGFSLTYITDLLRKHGVDVLASRPRQWRREH